MQSNFSTSDFVRPRSALGERSRTLELCAAMGATLATYAFFSGTLHFSRYYPWIADRIVPLLMILTVAAVASLPAGTRPNRSSLGYLGRALVPIAILYIALQRPIFPVLDARLWYSSTAFDALWLVSLVITLVAWWRPPLLIFTGLYLLGSKAMAGHATGFPYDSLLDVQPLQQLVLFTGIGMAIVSVFPTFRRSSLPSASLANVLVFTLVSLHLASYLFSGLAKASLDGGPLSWPTDNRLGHLFYAGVINIHLVWQDIPGAVSAVSKLLAWGERPMAFVIFGAQLLAFSLFAGRRWAVLLLLIYDAMHIGIFFAQGANFFTWALVNVAVICALRRLPDRYFGLRPMLSSLVIMVLCATAFDKFYRVARLGWYDTLALNTARFEAVTTGGERARVPNAMLGLYSYPIAHMSFGFPPGGNYLPTATNGGTDYRQIAAGAANDCTFEAADMQAPYEHLWDGETIDRFVIGLHERLVARSPGPLPWHANVYWHHFWNPPSVFADFREIRLDEIERYEFVVDSLCLESGQDGPVAQTVGTIAHAIWLDPISRLSAQTVSAR